MQGMPNTKMKPRRCTLPPKCLTANPCPNSWMMVARVTTSHRMNAASKGWPDPRKPRAFPPAMWSRFSHTKQPENANKAMPNATKNGRNRNATQG